MWAIENSMWLNFHALEMNVVRGEENIVQGILIKNDY